MATPYDVGALLGPTLEHALGASARTWLTAAEAALDEKGAAHLTILFPQIARTVGRHALQGTRLQTTHAGEALDVDLSAWRVCDAVGTLLIHRVAPDDALLMDLYLHGDIEERAIVLRGVALRPISPATIDLLGEIQRTNTTAHFEAGGLDSNVIVRAVQAGGADAGFTLDDYYRFILKMAFSDMPVARAFDAMSYASTELSRMLQDFATEREAAGRGVWTDTNRFIARDPTSGSIARLIGGLEHGDDPTRQAAAEGVLALARQGEAGPGLAGFAAARLGREPVVTIRAVLEEIGGVFAAAKA